MGWIDDMKHLTEVDLKWLESSQGDANILTKAMTAHHHHHHHSFFQPSYWSHLITVYAFHCLIYLLVTICRSHYNICVVIMTLLIKSFIVSGATCFAKYNLDLRTSCTGHCSLFLKRSVQLLVTFNHWPGKPLCLHLCMCVHARVSVSSCFL